jgi:hypothetical protein
LFSELITDFLQNGHMVRFKAPGHSMFPTIMANETVLVEPISPVAVNRGDIILYRCNGNLVAHRVMAIVTDTAANDYSSLLQAFSASGRGVCKNNKKCSTGSRRLFILRGDAAGSFDEPVEADQVLGKIVSIQRWGRNHDPYSIKHRFVGMVFAWALRVKNRLKSNG